MNEKLIDTMDGSIKVIDLFCGCGGMSYGFIEAGYDVVLGIDHWKDAILTFKHNHINAKVIISDLSKSNASEIAKNTDIKSVDIIIGGPPCQGFSIAGNRIIEDERNELYKSFIEFISYYQPKAFVMENVPNIVSMGKGAIREKILQDFEGIGYKVVYKVLTAADYGVPQNRKRAVFVGLKNGKEFIFPTPTYKTQITTSDAISDLPEYGLEDGSSYPSSSKTGYQEMMINNSCGIFNHQITNHSLQTTQIISMVPDGGNYKNLPEHLQGTRNVHIAWTRLNSKKPSFTIDTGHRHHFHYKYNRVPTVRESARIQSFPDEFIFLGSKTSQYKQVGNAVPPLLAKVIAENLKNYL